MRKRRSRRSPKSRGRWRCSSMAGRRWRGRGRSCCGRIRALPLIPSPPSRGQAPAGIQYYATRTGSLFRGAERQDSGTPHMSLIAKVLIALVALEHLYFLVLEMFLWEKPRTRAAFGMSAEQAAQSKVLAANQGLYNGFLAAGLIWALLAPAAYAMQLALFFLACVLVAGIYGGFTANKRIWLLQALPAALALAAGFFTLSFPPGTKGP